MQFRPAGQERSFNTKVRGLRAILGLVLWPGQSPSEKNFPSHPPLLCAVGMACGLIRTMFAGLKKGFLNAKPPPEESFNPDHFPPMIPAYRLVPESEYSAAN